MSSSYSSGARFAAVAVLLVGLAGCGGQEALSVPSAAVSAPAEPVANASADSAGSRDSSASDPDAAAEPGEVTLQADLYSGRVNPSWPLNDEESFGFGELLGTLAEGECSDPPRSGLGFRGFQVTGLELGRVEVDDDCVRIEGEDGSMALHPDSRRLAHRYLADLAGHRDPSLRPLFER